MGPRLICFLRARPSSTCTYEHTPWNIHTHHKLTRKSTLTQNARRCTCKGIDTALLEHTPPRTHSHTHQLTGSLHITKKSTRPRTHPGAHVHTPSCPPKPMGARPREGGHTEDTGAPPEAHMSRAPAPPWCAHLGGRGAESGCAQRTHLHPRSCPRTRGGSSGGTVSLLLREQGRRGVE